MFGFLLMFFMMETNSLLVLAKVTLSLDIAKRMSTELNTFLIWTEKSYIFEKKIQFIANYVGS